MSKRLSGKPRHANPFRLPPACRERVNEWLGLHGGGAGGECVASGELRADVSGAESCWSGTEMGFEVRDEVRLTCSTRSTRINSFHIHVLVQMLTFFSGFRQYFSRLSNCIYLN